MAHAGTHRQRHVTQQHAHHHGDGREVLALHLQYAAAFLWVVEEVAVSWEQVVSTRRGFDGARSERGRLRFDELEAERPGVLDRLVPGQQAALALQAVGLVLEGDERGGAGGQGAVQVVHRADHPRPQPSDSLNALRFDFIRKLDVLVVISKSR